MPPDSALQPLLDTEILRSFVAIAETESFTQAAAEVFRTPSALSMQIKRLEEQVGHQLFVREARRVTLTGEGEAMLGYARRLLKLNQEAISHFTAPELEGTVKMGTPDDIGTRILPQVLTQFSRSHPAVKVNVIVGRSIDMMKQLDAGKLDLVLITIGKHSRPARGEIVHSEPLVWAGAQSGIAVTQSPLPLALASQGCPWRHMALEALDRSRHRYRVAYTSEHCAGQEAAMQADLAIGPFPLSLIQPPLQQLGDEYELPPLGDYQIAMVHRGEEGSASHVLASHVRSVFRALRL
ncbi:MAG: LysR family transcriptional regulator [Pseudomonadales bacterium]|nr:LysR family transcriptional regulator [Pseudomonadales bacterium]